MGAFSNFLEDLVDTIKGDVYDAIERKELNYAAACQKTDAAARAYSREANWFNYHSASAAELEERCHRLERAHLANPYDVGLANAYNAAYAELRRHQHEAKQQLRAVRSAEKDLHRAQRREQECWEDYTYWD